MPSVKDKLVKNSASLEYTEKFLTICHTGPGPGMNKEVK